MPENPSTPATAADARGRILLVDDVFDNRAILGRRFERRGYQVVEADCGERALELIAGQAFDVVLLDVMMPDLDGREVLRRIRFNHSSAELPVIMVTARSQSEDVVEALTLGANDYITKPVDFAVALARVGTQIARKTAEDQARCAVEALRGANEELERRVAERTAELTETNGRLLLARARAESANRSKDEFLANMSHELRTPLNGVIGMAQVLTHTPLTPTQAEMVSVINTSAAGLQTILSDLLDMVALSAGSVALEIEGRSLGELVRAAAAQAAAHAGRKGLGFSVELSPDAEGEAEVDPDRLSQVLANLLGNAVKFTERGQVALRVSRRPVDGDMVLFEVSDTGVGFDPETAEQLFNRFEQADGSSTRRFGGVGLGLTICRELVEQMGGEISAEGRPDEGAVFRVEVPLPRVLGANLARSAA